MSAAGQPSEVLETPCGRVKVSPPSSAGGYWRIEWYEHAKRKQTSGGRSQETATAKVAEVLERLDRKLSPNSTRRLQEAREAYEVFMRSEKSVNHATKTIPDLQKALKAFDRLRCEVLDESHLVDACNASSTNNTAGHRRSRLRTFIRWGRQQGYFSREQTLFLETYVFSPAKVVVKRRERSTVKKKAGESELFVTKDQVPTHDALVDLGRAFQKILRYGELLVEFTYSSGLRSGELYGLKDTDVDLDALHAAVARQILSLSGLPTREAPPKHELTRVTNSPDHTVTGFPLLKRLEQRCVEVRREHDEGSNPHRLLFPAPMGGWWWASAFTSDFFAIAAKDAAWEAIHYKDAQGKDRRMWVHTMHSLRHRFARDRIDIWGYMPAELQVVGGWQNAQVVWDRYYGFSKDLLSRADSKLRRPPLKDA